MFNHIKHSFPKLIQENTESGRLYLTENGLKYPSVTTVLSNYNKEGILKWRNRVGEEEANKVSRIATFRGNAVHKAIETYLKNEDMSKLGMLPTTKSLFLQMKKELVKLNNIHCLEERLFSHELRLAGTVDCIAEYDGVLSVIDFKTSKNWKEEKYIGNYYMQGAAYSTMFTELTGIEIKQVIILIGVDTEFTCQVMKVKPEDHIDELKTHIDNYWRTK